MCLKNPISNQKSEHPHNNQNQKQVEICTRKTAQTLIQNNNQNTQKDTNKKTNQTIRLNNNNKRNE